MENKKINCTEDMILYNIYWGDIDDDSFSLMCNIGEEDLKKELSYFKANVEFDFLWEEFPNYLNEIGYTAERYFNEEPTYICYDEA